MIDFFFPTETKRKVTAVCRQDPGAKRPAGQRHGGGMVCRGQKHSACVKKGLLRKRESAEAP